MRKLFCPVGALLFLVALPGTAAPQCDREFVTVKAKAVSVTPTGGGNDTANIQCAFDLGAAMGPGASVQLAAGTFYTEQLVVRNFTGRISGMGQGVTVLHSPAHPLPIDRPCLGSGPCFPDEPPSDTNRYPSLVSLLGPDVTMEDLSVVVSGGFGTERWYLWGGTMELLSNALQVMGSGGTYRIQRVSIDAGTISASGGVNRGDAANAAMMWSFSRPWFVTGATLVLSDSTLRGTSGIFTYQIDRSRVFIRHNRFEVASLRILVGDTRESQVMVEGNEFLGLTVGAKTGVGFRLVPGNLGTGVVDSSIWFANNVLTANVGFGVAPGIAVNVKCELVNNDVTEVNTPYVFNGYPCKVVGGQ